MRSIIKQLEQPYRIKVRYKKNQKDIYHMVMNNMYMNGEGKVYKKQTLDSRYRRKIKQSIKNCIVFTNYQWDSILFINRLPKKKPEVTHWSFASGIKFDSHMILSEQNLANLYEEEKTDVSHESYNQCFVSLESACSKLPKLPSSYLVIMQSFDIVSFENFMSYIYVESSKEGGWKLGEWRNIKPSEFTHVDQAQIGMGFYNTASFFKNGTLHLRLSGYTKEKERVCILFDYYCDNSSVSVMEKDNIEMNRTGTSYYLGQIYVDVQSGNMIKATIEENYIAKQKGKKDENIIIKRRVLCELEDVVNE